MGWNGGNDAVFIVVEHPGLFPLFTLASSRRCLRPEPSRRLYSLTTTTSTSTITTTAITVFYTIQACMDFLSVFLLLLQLKIKKHVETKPTKNTVTVQLVNNCVIA